MDYGHSQKSGNTGDFFTAEAGDSLESMQKNDNLDLANESWNNQSKKESLSTEKAIDPGDNTANKEPKNTAELGKIIDISMPPNAANNNSNNIDPSKAYASSIENKVFEIKGDRIDKRAILELKKDESRLNHTKDIAGFYENIREELFPATMKESYGEQSAWRDAA